MFRVQAFGFLVQGGVIVRFQTKGFTPIYDLVCERTRCACLGEHPACVAAVAAALRPTMMHEQLNYTCTTYEVRYDAAPAKHFRHRQVSTRIVWNVAFVQRYTLKFENVSSTDQHSEIPSTLKVIGSSLKQMLLQAQMQMIMLTTVPC